MALKNVTIYGYNVLIKTDSFFFLIGGATFELIKTQ